MLSENSVPVHVDKLHPDALVPTLYQPPTGHGYLLHSAPNYEGTLLPGQHRQALEVQTGLVIKVPVGFIGLVLPLPHLLDFIRIDLTHTYLYPGDVSPLLLRLLNRSPTKYVIGPNWPIAQFVLLKTEHNVRMVVDNKNYF